jgi:hypothetical protein
VSPYADLKARQPEMIPQCDSGVLLAVDAAPLELRDHQPHERLEGAGQIGRATTKPLQARSVNHSSKRSAISFGLPTQGFSSRPRPVSIAGRYN